MATLQVNGISMAVDGPIKDACEELGIPFGCRSGMCGTCRVTVESGMQHLGPKNEMEMQMGLADDERLCCQCILQEGTVSIRL